MSEPAGEILAAPSFAVVGASRSPEKYGSLVYRALKQAGKSVYAVNPNGDEVDGDPAFATLAALPSVPNAAVMIVPPSVTATAVAECARLNIRRIWMQPGAESESAVAACRANGITVVANGPCILVMLRTLGYL
ncbi:MAG: CoA-binding protein [Armatimonadota bacterium]|nr:CoA-binding protein [Armatimonadota bacterium]